MKILVAGAGLGGLAAASLLSENGHDVTVFEARKKDDLGYNWEDRFSFDILEKLTGQKINGEYIRARGDCAFISPSYKSSVIIKYNDENRQRIMQRIPLINMLIDFAIGKSVKIKFETRVTPVIDEDGVKGLHTEEGDILADLVIDAAGVFSALRSSIPDKYLIDRKPSRGEVFYARRAYFKKSENEMPDIPFEVYLCHDREPGLSWCCINEDSVDILIGRTDPVSTEKFEKCADNFRKSHPCIGEETFYGVKEGVIPVRRCLPVMTAPGYAAVGDSAFMTTPMNGMGIDLSLNAGMILADTVNKAGNADIDTLWEYNKEFIRKFGAVTARNEGLKNSLLKMADYGVDFLFENSIIQASDLSGAGANTGFSTLMGKFIRGMKNPRYFFILLSGLISGSKLKNELLNIPEHYDTAKIKPWRDKINMTLN